MTKTESANNTVHTELGILPKLISLPRQPISVRWELDESDATGTGSLRALLSFSTEDKDFILSQSGEFDAQSNDRVNYTFYDDWLPTDAKINITIKSHGEMCELIGVHPRKPNLFTNTELSPYVNGSITPLSGGYILVSLYSM